VSAGRTRVSTGSKRVLAGSARVSTGREGVLAGSICVFARIIWRFGANFGTALLWQAVARYYLVFQLDVRTFARGDGLGNLATAPSRRPRAARRAGT